ncbi:hypothetical protein RHSIM_Rhsim02G0204200 [Rhododendron simsii]|uniref:NAC domain-containing protein n=1 Tax=Rhododendron simsii TaxID=118357 RepID=A0A834HE34_RHOSS|nr:hypothetical protein RHSIM_Rhsim02G0204200 [Rhododendron simsii]
MGDIQTKDKKTDLWKTEGTIYVFTTLIKASQNRIARKAGCGSWHGETTREGIKNDKDCAIGYKTTLRLPPTNLLHWTGLWKKATGSCKSTLTVMTILIKFRNPQSVLDHITATPDTEVVPFSKDQQFVQDQSFLMSDDPNELTLDQDFDEVLSAYLNDDITVPKSAKRVRTERFTMNNDANELTIEELEAIWEQEEQGSYSPWHCDNSALVPLNSNTVTSITTFGLDCNTFGNISSTPGDDWVLYSNPSHIGAKNLSNTKAWLSAELLPSDQESEGFLFPNSMFHPTSEPSPIFSFSNDLFLDQQKNNMSEHLPSIYGGEIDHS